jgi:hypothetical protein
MSERNPMYQHPEWDLPGTAKALIGVQPVAEGASDAPEANVPHPSQPETAPLRIAVGQDASLTLHPQEEAVEYRQETPQHTIYLRSQ